MGISSTSFKKGYKQSPEVTEKVRRAKIGRKHTPEARKHMSEAQKRIGNIPPSALGIKRSQEFKNKVSKANLGRPRPDIAGKNSNNWKGGITPINIKIRMSLEYKLWRRAVFERDNYTCIWCKQRGGKLNADHIKPFAYFPELRFAIDNGRTLCIDCHKTTDTYGSKKSNEN